jgi:LysR family pca operon transcriptional activator
VRPTAAGVAVIRVARRVLGELRRMEAELDALGAVEGGSIAVGVLPVAAVGILPGALIALRAARPGLRVRLHQGRTEELLPLLASRELDLVVGRLYAPAVPDGLQRLPMWEEPIAVLARAGHPLLRRRGAVTAAALAGYEMVLPTSASASGRRSSTCSTCRGTCPCARPPTASSGRCCWRATRCPSCRAR